MSSTLISITPESAWPCSAPFALPPKGRWHYGIHHRRHKLYFFCFVLTARVFSQLTAQAKQLLRRQSRPARHRADRVATRSDLRNNSSLVRVAPIAPTAGSGEDREQPHQLSDNSMHRVYSKRIVQTEPQARTSRWPLNDAYLRARPRAFVSPASPCPWQVAA